MRRFVCCILAFAMIIATSQTVEASLPYKSYNFDHWDRYVPTPSPYEPSTSLSGDKLGVGSLNNPSDIFVSPSNEVYLLDSGNNRVIVLDSELKLIKVVDEFMLDGAVSHFNKPGGLFVDSDDSLYVADTGNKRIVRLSPTGELVRIIDQKPDSMDPRQDFSPTKIVVDDAKRLYVIAANVFEGIMCYSEDGTFFSYFGTIKVKVNPIDWVWRILATKEQRSKLMLYVPTEFTSIDIDSKGFIFSTNVDTRSETMIKRLNPSGNDVIKNYSGSKIIGDLFFRLLGTYSGPTMFVDIEARDKGMYSALDFTRGRIYTYDSEGNLLYIFGGYGSLVGMFNKAVAIEELNGKLLVLDQNRGEVIVFSPTEYGALINKAVALRYDGDETLAVEYWREVMKLDSNYELAYAGIGKSLLSNNQNREAMYYLKKGNDVQNYSIAFRRYRTEVMKENLANLLTLGVVLTGGLFAYRIWKRRKATRLLTEQSERNGGQNDQKVF